MTGVGTVWMLVAPATGDLAPGERQTWEMVCAEVTARERVQALAAEHGSASLAEHPTSVVLATGDSRPVTRHFTNGYACPWCTTGVDAGAPGCPNPCCAAFPGLTVERIRDVLESWRAGDERRDRSAREAEFSQRYAEQCRREGEARWAELATEADRRQACVRCLLKSNWRSGQPRYVRHRSDDFHAREE